MVKLLKRPRKIMLMVKAGKPVDEFIETLLPHLEPGDLIIDGGNSHFPDTIRRTKYLESKGLLFIGTGVSGGEEGARFGPSMMPGGSVAAWPLVKDIFQAICAKTPEGEPCCDWVGEDGAGHYVKMVHNGIEYGDMQLICEAYQLMKEGLGMSNEEMHDVFAEWNKGELDSYLIEITRDILGYKDENGRVRGGQDPGHRRPEGHRQVDQRQFARSGHAGDADRRGRVRPLPERHEGRPRGGVSKILTGPKFKFDGDKKAFVEDIRQALLASKIVSYAQGFMLLREAAKEYKWDLQLRRHRHGVARRLHHPQRVPGQDQGGLRRPIPNLSNLLLDEYFNGVIERCQASWRRVVAQGRGGRRARARVHDGARVLRRLPQRAAAGQPAAGAARLLRRPHLRARGPAARQVLPHQLDGQGRQRLGRHVHGVAQWAAGPAPALSAPTRRIV